MEEETTVVGGGAYSIKAVSLEAGATYNVVVGIGGTGGGGSVTEHNGTDSWFAISGNVLVLAKGSEILMGTNFGGDKSRGIGDTKFSGGSGAGSGAQEGGGGGSSAGTASDGQNGASGGESGGAGGSAPGGGSGGQGGAGSSSGVKGAEPGGGGGGGGSTAGGAAGAGADGRVVLSW